MTFSTPKRAALALLLAAGCAAPSPTREVVQHNPQPDQATLLRNFPRSTAYYSNGDVVAWTNYRIDSCTWGSDSVQQDETTLITAFPTFVVETVTAPVRMIFQPPGKRVTTRDGADFPPSFTVSPPK